MVQAANLQLAARTTKHHRLAACASDGLLGRGVQQQGHQAVAFVELQAATLAGKLVISRFAVDIDAGAGDGERHVAMAMRFGAERGRMVG